MKTLRVFGTLAACLVQIPLDAQIAQGAPLAADTPSTTATGNTFIAPADWSLLVDGAATIIEAPEGDSRVVLIDVSASDADAAVQKAWTVYRPDAAWPLKSTTSSADKDGWTDRRTYVYQTSPNERRSSWRARCAAPISGRFGSTTWRMRSARSAARKSRQSSVASFRKATRARASRAARRTRSTLRGSASSARSSSAARLCSACPAFRSASCRTAKWFSQAASACASSGNPRKSDAETLYMIASNTKAMTTLMLGTLVDEKKLTWDTRVIELLPQFKLGSADTTQQGARAPSRLRLHGAAAAGFRVAARIRGRDSRNGARDARHDAADERVRSDVPVFEPSCGRRRLRRAHTCCIRSTSSAPPTTRRCRSASSGRSACAPRRSTSREALRGELRLRACARHRRPRRARRDGCELFDRRGAAGRRCVEQRQRRFEVRPDGARERCARRRQALHRGGGIEGTTAPQVWIGKDAVYGMGLIVDRTYGVSVVSHGGSMIGYKSNMLWLPEHGVGAVILTNSDPGGTFRDFSRASSSRCCLTASARPITISRRRRKRRERRWPRSARC